MEDEQPPTSPHFRQLLRIVYISRLHIYAVNVIYPRNCLHKAINTHHNDTTQFQVVIPMNNNNATSPGEFKFMQSNGFQINCPYLSRSVDLIRKAMRDDQ